MNNQALEYWLDGNELDYETFEQGYVVKERILSNDFLGEISACGGFLRISTTGEFLIIDAEKIE